MLHPISNEHLLQGCATCVRRRAAEAVREFAKSNRRMSETLNAVDKRATVRETRVLDAKADQLEGKSQLTCTSCAEIETRSDSTHCRRCGGELVRADEIPSEDAHTRDARNDIEKRAGRGNASEAIKVFRANMKD